MLYIPMATPSSFIVIYNVCINYDENEKLQQFFFIACNIGLDSERILIVGRYSIQFEFSLLKK